MTIEQNKFILRMEQKVEKKGLADIKFFASNINDVTMEQFFEAANEIEDLIQSGNVTKSTTWQHDPELTTVHL